MNRFSTRLAASVIQDRHRAAAAIRRSELRAAEGEPSAGPKQTRRISWPIRVRAGAR